MCKLLLPHPRRKFLHSTGRMLINPLQHIGEIGVGVDVMQSTSGQQALDYTNILSSYLCPVKQPVLSPHRYHPQCPLQMVGINGHIRITEVGFELLLVVLYILQRPG